MSMFDIKLSEDAYRRLELAARRRKTTVRGLIQALSAQFAQVDRLRATFEERKRRVDRAEFRRLAQKIRRAARAR